MPREALQQTLRPSSHALFVVALCLSGVGCTVKSSDPIQKHESSPESSAVENSNTQSPHVDSSLESGYTPIANIQTLTRRIQKYLQENLEPSAESMRLFTSDALQLLEALFPLSRPLSPDARNSSAYKEGLITLSQALQILFNQTNPLKQTLITSLHRRLLAGCQNLDLKICTHLEGWRVDALASKQILRRLMIKAQLSMKEWFWFSFISI